MCNPPLRPIAPSSTGQASKGGQCTSGSGHTEPGSLLFEKVLVSSGSSAVATGKARSGTTGVEGCGHKAAAHERPNRGRDDESPSRAEQRKNNDATTTHPPNRPLPNAASTKGWHFVPYVTPPEKWLFSDSCPNLLSDARIAPRCTVSPRTAPTRTASLSPIDRGG